jgi:hypothetical protein
MVCMGEHCFSVCPPICSFLGVKSGYHLQVKNVLGGGRAAGHPPMAPYSYDICGLYPAGIKLHPLTLAIVHVMEPLERTAMPASSCYKLWNLICRHLLQSA